MPQIILGPGLEKIDGSLQKATYSFLAKLAQDDTMPKLHIEPINNSVDPRARTGRVDLSNRAVLFKLQGSQQDASYLFIGTFPHDEAIAIARKSRVDINPRNGVAELIPVDEPSPPIPVTGQPEPTPAATTEAADEPSLRARQYTVDDFIDLGFDAAFAEGALDLVGADALLEYAAAAPAAWQGSALLDLYTGESFSAVRQRYQLGVPVSTDSADDDTLLEALRHPAAQMEFAFIEDDDELRAAIENPDFVAWRIFLHPEQRGYTTRDYNGAFRLTGGAGTGKTVVLLHRARELHRKNPGSRIILTTYNRTLADALKDQLKVLDPSVPLASDLGKPGVYIAGVDVIAHRVIATAPVELAGSAGDPGAVIEVLGPRTAQILKPTRPRAWAAAVEDRGDDLPADLRAVSFLEAEYATVILPNLVTTREEYLKVRRPGRGVALNRSRRNALWDIVEAYRAAAAADGTTDFEEKAAIAAHVLTKREGARFADHVLVDEAQDLSPCRLMLLRALVAPGLNDLFLAEDSHQRIYGQRIVLSRYGINIVGRSRRLMLNYRTTAQNLRYAPQHPHRVRLHRLGRRAGGRSGVSVIASWPETCCESGWFAHRGVRRRGRDRPEVDHRRHGTGDDRAARPHPQGGRKPSPRPGRSRRECRVRRPGLSRATRHPKGDDDAPRKGHGIREGGALRCRGQEPAPALPDRHPARRRPDRGAATGAIAALRRRHPGTG